MTLRLYDSRAQALRDFAPLDDDHVTMYVCGPTVQSGPHIGHLRAGLEFDLLRRWLEHRYGRVTFVRNVTDIDDKVLTNATDEEAWWALAYRMEREFTEAYETIGILPPTYEPRATAALPQIIEFIQRLIDGGHAYAAGGDVYFDVGSWPDYGALTHQSTEQMAADEEADPRGKRAPHDFALWKGAKPDEPASARWQSPWGAGRPGWHIECSAMSRHFLGPEFDIHGGGLDLRFPHHENELAQSSAAGDPFARYWVHNGLVTVDGQKMSKSIGNVTLARDVLRAHPDPLVVRYALAAAHYRSNLDLTHSSWAEAEAALARIRGFLERAERVVDDNAELVDRDGLDPDRLASRSVEDAVAARGEEGVIPGAFAEAMDDDLSVPQALAVLHETVRRGNSALDDGESADAEIAYHHVRAMAGVLGLDPLAAGDAAGASGDALNRLMEALIAARKDARAEKDWGKADLIRDMIAAAGITLEDSRDTTVWSIDG